MTTPRKSAARSEGRRGAKTTQEKPARQVKRDDPTTVTANGRAVRDEELTAAMLQYAGIGWRVFPCRGKVPAISKAKGGSGFHDATTDPAKLAEWAREYPGANIGGRPPAGHFVVDVDTQKNPAKLGAFADKLIDTGAPYQRTGRGGVHVLFSGDAPREKDLLRKAGVDDGIEVITHASLYIILAPSVHPETGKTYRWERGISEYGAPQLPAGLRINVGPYKPADDDKEPMGLTVAEQIEMAGYLPRNRFVDYPEWTKFGMAAHHENGASPEGVEVFEAITEPGGRDEPADKYETYGSYDGPLITMRTFAREAEKLGWRSPAKAERAMAEFEADDFLAGTLAMHFNHETEPPPVPFAFRGVFPLGKVSLLAGAGGAGKSYLALSLGAHYVARKSFGSWFVPDHHAQTDCEALLLFAEEDRKDIEWRYFHTMQATGFTDAEVRSVRRRMHMKSLLSLRATASLAEYSPDNRREVVEGALLTTLRRVLKGRPMIRFVVLDPMLVLHKLEENDNGAMGNMMLLLAEVAHEAGCAIVLTHHFSKTGAKSDDLNEMSVRGASSITSESRAVVVVRGFARDDCGALENVSPDEIERIVELRLPKHNYAAAREPFYLRVGAHGEVKPMSPQPVSVSGPARRVAIRQAANERAAEVRDTTCLRALLALVDDHPDITSTDIYKRKPARASRTIVEPVLKQAVQDRLIETREGKRNALHHQLTRAGRDALAVSPTTPPR